MNLVHELDDRALLQLGTTLAKLLQSNEARIGVTQDTVPVSASWCTRGESSVQVI